MRNPPRQEILDVSFCLLKVWSAFLPGRNFGNPAREDFVTYILIYKSLEINSISKINLNMRGELSWQGGCCPLLRWMC